MDGAGNTGNLTFNISTTSTIVIDGTSRTLGILNIGDFNHDARYTLAANAGCYLVMDNKGAGAKITEISTSIGDLINAPVVMKDDLAISNESPNSFILAASGASISGSGNLTINANSTGAITLQSGSLNHTGMISNSGTGTGVTTISSSIGSNVTQVIQNSASSVLVLSGANKHTGTTTIMSGTLRTMDVDALGLGVLKLMGGTLQLDNNNGLGYNRDTIVLGDANIQSDILKGASTAGVTYTLGTLSIGSQALLVNSGTNVKTGTAGISFGAVTLSGSATFDVASGAGLTLASIGGLGQSFMVSGSGNTTITGIVATSTGGLAKTGAGMLILSASNSYSGGTILDGGTVSFVSGGLGASGIIGFTGGCVLQYGSGNTQDLSSRLASSTAAMEIDTGTNNVTYSNPLSSTNSGGLTKSGVGTLTLSAPNSYSGGTVIASGTVKLGAAGALGAAPNDLSIIGGALNLNGNSVSLGLLSGSNGAVITSGTSGAVTLSTSSSGSSIYSGAIRDGSGTLSLIKAGTGTLALTGSNNFTGGTTIANGALNFTSNSLGTSGTILFAGGVLQYGAGSTQDLSSRIGNSSAAIAIDTGANTVSYASVLNSTNIGGLTKSGTGTLLLSASNGYTGLTTITTGTLKLGNANALGVISNDLTINGGALNLNGNSVTVGSLSGSNGAVIASGIAGTVTVKTIGSSSSIYSGIIQNGSGIVGLIQAGTGMLTLTGSNSYTGGTTITTGTLQIGNGGSTGSINGNITDNGSLVFNRVNAIAVTGTISGSGSLVQKGAGILTLSASNSYSGGTIISSGTVNFTNGALGSSGAISFTGAGGTLQYAAGNTQDFSNRIGNSSAAIAIDTGANTVTYLNALGSTNTGGLIKGGFGTLILSAPNSYSGGTTITSGTIKLGAAGALGAAPNDLSIIGGALNLNGNSVSVGLLSGGAGAVITSETPGAAMVTGTSAGSSIYAGSIRDGLGSVSLTKAGTGTLMLSGSHSYTGPTSVTGGKLVVSGSLYGTTTVTVSDAELNVGGMLNRSAGVTVNSGGILSGKGVMGAVVLADGGTLAPGTDGTGKITMAGLSSSGPSVLSLQITKAAGENPDPGANYDQVIVSSGDIALDGITLSLEGTGVKTGDLFFLILNGGPNAVSGSFVNSNGFRLEAGNPGFLLNGQLFQISYDANSGNGSFSEGKDVALMAVPEPETWAMVAGGLGMLIFTQGLRGRRH